jgi:undecaprenyl-diphosphatase
VTFIAAMLLVRLLKEAIGRPRPLNDFAELIASGAVSVHVLFEPLRQFSMPSGHATLAFASATALARLHGRYAALFLGAAVLVALSRIYVGAHFPSDVVVGAAVGAGVAIAAHYLWYGRWKTVDTATGPR